MTGLPGPLKASQGRGPFGPRPAGRAGLPGGPGRASDMRWSALECAGNKLVSMIENDPLEVLAECQRLLGTIDLTALTPKGRGAVGAVMSLNNWTLRGGTPQEWGSVGQRAVNVVGEMAKILWPQGTLETTISEEKAIAVMDLLRFSGFGPQEGLI